MSKDKKPWNFWEYLGIGENSSGNFWKFLGIPNNSRFNPFVPEAPVTARADPGPFYPL